MARNPTNVTPIPLAGGLNLAAPPLAAQPGECRVMHNYVCDALGQYERIAGFHRVDGKTDLLDHYFVALKFDKELPDTVIEQLHGVRVSDKKGHASGKVLHSYKDELLLVEVEGEFHQGDLLDHVTIEPYTVVREFVNGSSHHVSVTQLYRHLTQSYHRPEIMPVPGTGPIRGVAYYGNELLAWRDNDAGSETIAWRASETGWSPIPTIPPRIYSPPFEYDYLIFSGQAGTDCYEDKTDPAAAKMARTFQRGYFETKIGYGELLLPRPGIEAEHVKGISYFHPDPEHTVLRLDPGVDLDLFGAIEVYVEDQPMYRFIWHEASDDPDNPDPYYIQRDGTAYEIIIPDCVELWDARQRVGFMYRAKSEVPPPPPDPNIWTFEPPGSVAEGETLTLDFLVTQADGTTPVANAELHWSIDGIQAEDLSSGSLDGVAQTDADGRMSLSWTFVEDGLEEGEAILFRGHTDDGGELEATIEILDTQLGETSHRYGLSGPSSIVQSGRGTFVITVTNIHGERVADQDVDWRVTGMTASAFYMAERSGTVTTDESGQASVEVRLSYMAPAYGHFDFELTAPVSQSLGCTVGRKDSTPTPPSSSTGPGVDGSFWMTPEVKSNLDNHVFDAESRTMGFNTYLLSGRPKFGSANGTGFRDFAVRGLALIETKTGGESGFHLVLGRTTTNALKSVSVKFTLDYVDSPNSRKRLTTLTSTPSNSTFSADGAYRFTWFKKSGSYYSNWSSATGLTLVSIEVL